jgi:hypothetical protein
VVEIQKRRASARHRKRQAPRRPAALCGPKRGRNARHVGSPRRSVLGWGSSRPRSLLYFRPRAVGTDGGTGLTSSRPDDPDLRSFCPSRQMGGRPGLRGRRSDGPGTAPRLWLRSARTPRRPNAMAGTGRRQLSPSGPPRQARAIGFFAVGKLTRFGHRAPVCRRDCWRRRRSARAGAVGVRRNVILFSRTSPQSSCSRACGGPRDGSGHQARGRADRSHRFPQFPARRQARGGLFFFLLYVRLRPA